MKSNKPLIFDTLTHFVTGDAGINLEKPLGMKGFLSYVQEWQNHNIKAVNLLSGACPKYKNNGEIIIPSKWEVNKGQIKEYRYKVPENGTETKIPITDDCYAGINSFVLEKLHEMAKNYSELNLFYSPMVHPKNTTVQGLERLVKEGGENILALKIHGISSASGPKDISSDLARAIAKSDIPLIIHTDYNNENHIQSINC